MYKVYICSFADTVVYPRAKQRVRSEGTWPERVSQRGLCLHRWYACCLNIVNKSTSVCSRNSHQRSPVWEVMWQVARIRSYVRKIRLYCTCKVLAKMRMFIKHFKEQQQHPIRKLSPLEWARKNRRVVRRSS